MQLRSSSILSVTASIMFVFSSIWTSPLHADTFRSRNDLAFGYTSNANYEPSDVDSDLFARVSTSNSYESQRNALGLRLGYTDYSSQNDNDVFTYRLFDRFKVTTEASKNAGLWSGYVAFLGQTYPQGSPANTDTSFDNVGFEVRAEWERKLSSHSELTLSPGSQFKRYTSFSDRTDQTFSMRSDLTYHVSNRSTAYANADLGIVRSSLADYNNTFIGAGGGFERIFARDWEWSIDLALHLIRFGDRTISVETATVRRRGQRIVSSSETQEAYRQLDLTTQITRDLSQSWRGAFTVTQTNQTSVSGLQNYNVTELSAHALYTF